MEADDATQRTMGSKEKLAAPVKDQKAERAGKEEGNDDGASVATTSDDSAASASGIQAAHKKINTGMGVLINCGEKGVIQIRLDKTMLVEDAIAHIIKVLGTDPWGRIPDKERALNYIGITMRPGKRLEEYGLIAGTDDTLSYLNQVSGRLGPMALRTKRENAGKKSRRELVCREIRQVMGLQDLTE